jgi:urocanate hydratase
MISTKCLLKVIIYMYFGRERLVVEYQNTGDLLVELGSDQTSCHNPYLGGYYPVQV